MNELEQRIEAMEGRLARIEALLMGRSEGPGPAAPPSMPPVAPRPRSTPVPGSVPPSPAAFLKSLARPTGHTPPELSVTRLLGWTGATALVLASAYLIRLAVESGWLTPERQVVLAVLSGFLLIGAGLRLRGADREYAGLLPAGGLVVLFLSVYGAHLYYHFIGIGLAAAAVILVCLGALWLGRLFESELFSLFAVAGSYSAPFMLSALAGSVLDLVVYFTAWSVLFCAYAVWTGVRRVYLLAAYMALLGFQVIYDFNDLETWVEAFAFQSVQFLAFLAGAVVFSVRRDAPMSRNEALVHLPLLLIFYALQYPLLDDHLPGWAPWIAMASAGLLLAAHRIARRRMARAPEAGGLLVGAYTALVLFHAGYMELVPHALAPWLALLVLPGLAYYLGQAGPNGTVAWPFRLLVGVIFAINYLRVVAEGGDAGADDHPALALFYAAELYAAYHFAQRLPGLKALAGPALYAGHIALMGGAVTLLEGRLAVSLAWGGLALACLALAFRVRDSLLGKSSLLVFAASAAKVLLFDLAEATPEVRIASLAVLGVTLYLGGWMYRKIDDIPPRG